jgi:hypothetical protein
MDLGEFLRRYLERKREVVEGGGGHLAFDSPQGLWVQADPARLEKVLDNLVDNALCHCPPGVHIRVSLARKQRLALVTVADDGPGIAPREQRKVVSRRELLVEVWGYAPDVATRTVDIFIGRLRRLLGDDPETPRMLQTLRGQGYLLVQPEQPA